MSNIVIIGAGHAAGQFIATLKQRQFAGKITLVGNEPWLPYQRPPLSKKYLAGDMPAERLLFKPPQFYDVPGVEVQLNTQATSINRTRKTVTTDAGDLLEYDQLVIATGSRARQLNVPGATLNGVHYLRGIADVARIRDGLIPGSRIAIIGAGYIGLEVAAVTRQMGFDVTVIEMADRVMSRVVSPEISAYYTEEHRSQGVDIRLSAAISCLAGNEKLEHIELEGGETIPADVAIVGIGIEPNTELAADAGLTVEHGVVVDDHCRTTDLDIYAIGDCTLHPNAIYGVRVRLESVHNALEQAKTAALNIVGEDTAYSEVPWFWSDQYDLKLQIAGLNRGFDQTVMRGTPAERAFSCIYLREGRVVAIDAINRPKDFVQCKGLIADGRRIDAATLADVSIDLKSM